MTNDVVLNQSEMIDKHMGEVSDLFDTLCDYLQAATGVDQQMFKDDEDFRCELMQLYHLGSTHMKEIQDAKEDKHG